jgi:hypothetical protein
MFNLLLLAILLWCLDFTLHLSGHQAVSGDDGGGLVGNWSLDGSAILALNLRR